MTEQIIMEIVEILATLTAEEIQEFISLYFLQKQ